MSDEFKLFFGGGVLGFLAATFLFANIATPNPIVDELRAEAIKRNAAEWIVDPATGNTTFTWKPIP